MIRHGDVSPPAERIMENKLTFVLVLTAILIAGLGCNWSFGTGSGNSQGGNTNADAMAKTGVKECDEFIELLSNDSKSPDEDFITRKIREYAIDFAKEAIKKNIEENQGDKEKIAQGCKEARDEYLKKKTEDAKGGNSNK